jgi:hypothetical protein
MAKSISCSYTEVWVHLKKLENINIKEKPGAKLVCWMQNFLILFLEKYLKASPFRKKLNKFRTLEEKGSYSFDWDPKLFEDKGWNQLLKIYDSKPKAGTLHPKQNFIEALEIAYLKLSVSDGVVKNFDEL